MRVLVAMSGGVDSSVAAAQLVEAGHEVVGATLKLWTGESDSGCCSVADAEDARRVAQVLGIDHHVFNYAEEFAERVVAPFVEDHRRGRSPNPCIECNRRVKFDLLVERARRLGFDALATGHHARVVRVGDRSRLARGVDERKDQSYVLGYLSRDDLERLVLPIGELTKDEVRSEAARRGLRTWDKPDSQDVCFIPASRGRAAFLAERLALTPAEVVDARSGEVVGELAAAELVSVGQRRGIAPGRDGERRYVARVDLVAGRVEVAPLEAILVREVVLEAGSLVVSGEPMADGRRVWAQCSAHGRPVAATLTRRDGWRVAFDEPVRPVAAGQSVVWYREDRPELVEGAGVAAGS
ncbi:MAG TPA: tRNA 2-thiouridine(34) synthase MnmA [Acidimicrobiales bacterium]|nr:tRNA 2-thiouridine(34) synthase MnmA [Acidimicrobiales bacterium]